MKRWLCFRQVIPAKSFRIGSDNLKRGTNATSLAAFNMIDSFLLSTLSQEKKNHTFYIKYKMAAATFKRPLTKMNKTYSVPFQTTAKI